MKPSVHPKPTTRCAIYTRKSSEEGLEQAFNSLHAQREACAAYIQSQRHEGWVELPIDYDDGGLSGGTLQRPALQQLLQHIRDGHIDTVVVYKVDRLTRSLADFAKIVDVFDAQGVSFVSVTQQFNTTSSMGRLTLNMLLSFAQFEREVTGERIRDKIAASKRKGMWMGGPTPLGYDAIDRKLVVNPTEAETVRLIFRRYLDLGAVDALCRDLRQQGVVAKVYSKDDGSSRGGQPLQRGALYRMLQNPIYRGQVRHRDTVYEGEHDAIVDDSLWKQVQERLQANRIADAHKTSARSPSLLAGLVWTEHGDPFTPSHASKKGKRYRYYVSRPQPERQEPRTRLWRIPAADLETLVLDQIRDLLGSVPRIRAMLQESTIAEFDQQVALDRAAALAEQLTDTSLPNLREDIRVLIVRVTVAEAGVAIRLSRQTLFRLLGLSDANSQKQTVIDLDVPVRLRRAGMEMRLIDERTATGPDPVLIALLSKAWTVRQDMLSGKAKSQADLAANHGVGSTYLGRLLRIGFLAPDIIETILGGRQPPDLTANRLAMIPDIPVDWDEQRKLILGNSRSRV